MANLYQEENPIICMDNFTGKPVNYYWLNDAHFAEQFPREWAHSQLPNTGSECWLCMTHGSWCGVLIGYCRSCAKLYRECGNNRGPGFISLGTEYDETDPSSANMTYLAGVPWRKVGKHELLEEQLRQYYYNQANVKLSKKLEKSDRKISFKRDALGGKEKMKIVQLEKQLKIREKAEKKQMKRSVEIESLIYMALAENEVDLLDGYETDIKIIDKSVKMIEATIGSYYSDPEFWDGHSLTRLGQEKTQKMTQKISDLRSKKNKIEKNVTHDELNHIEAYIKCLLKGELVLDSFTRTLPVSDNSYYWAVTPLIAFNDFVDRNELNIEELTY